MAPKRVGGNWGRKDRSGNKISLSLSFYTVLTFEPVKTIHILKNKIQRIKRESIETEYKQKQMNSAS